MWGNSHGGRRGGHHSSVYGTEQDPHNCSFFLRIGSCRHGACCPKKHTYPTFSNTLLLEHIWVPSKKIQNSKKKRTRHYERFVEDLVEEMSKHGDILETLTMENQGDHLIGNTFIKFSDEEQAAEAKKLTHHRHYAGRQVVVKFSPVNDFDNARCRDYVSGHCQRGAFCNFAHFMEAPKWVSKFLKSNASQSLRDRRLSKRTREGEFPIGGSDKARRKCIERWNAEREAKLGVRTKSENSAPASNPSALNLYKPN